jgi:hypothetical protein
MRNEVIKGFTMLLLIVVLAFATAVASANAQSAKKLVADIPFEFVVGDQPMASGEYTLKANGMQGQALIIQSRNAKCSAIRLTNAIERPRSQGHETKARLVFHRYGQRYFLAQVWSGADSTGRQLLKSRQERAIERELASIRPQREQTQSAYETVEIVEIVATLR